MSNNAPHVDLDRRLDAWADAQQLTPRADLQRELNRTLKESLKPVKPLPSNGALALQFLLAFLTAAAALIAVLDKAGIRMMTAVQIAGMAAILVGGVGFFTFQLVSRMIPGSSRAGSLPLGLALFLLGTGAAMTALFPWRMPQAFLAEGWPCAVLELALAVPAAGVFWFMARRGALPASAGSATVVTALAVCLGLIADQSQCMFLQAPHLLVWHGGTAAVLIAAGAVTGLAGRVRKP